MGVIADRVRAKVATGAVTEVVRADGQTEYLIPRAQRNIHVTFEALAVFVAAPALFYIAATNKQMPAWQRGALAAIGGASVIVDGYLLVQYARSK